MGDYRFTAALGALLCLCGISGWSYYLYQHRIAERFAEQSSTQPQQWPDKRFSALWKTTLDPKLLHGKWIVVQYRAGCPVCLPELRQYEALAAHLNKDKGYPHFAILAVGAETHTQSGGVNSEETSCIYGNVLSGPVANAVTSLLIDNDKIKYVSMPSNGW